MTSIGTVSFQESWNREVSEAEDGEGKEEEIGKVDTQIS